MKNYLVLSLVLLSLVSCNGKNNGGAPGNAVSNQTVIHDDNVQLQNVHDAQPDEVIALMQNDARFNQRLELGDQYVKVEEFLNKVTMPDGSRRECYHKETRAMTLVYIDEASDTMKAHTKVSDDFSKGNCAELGEDEYEHVLVMKISEELGMDMTTDLGDARFSIGTYDGKTYVMINTAMDFSGDRYQVKAMIKTTRPLWAESDYVQIKKAGQVISQAYSSEVKNVDISGLDWQDLQEVTMEYNN